MRIAFFGTPDLAVSTLQELQIFGIIPELIVTTPDASVGRKQVITPPPVKIWAEALGIPTFQPTTLKDPNQLTSLTDQTWDLFVVFAYGKIIPEWLLQLPKYGTINAHPSLLPKLRGASPIRSTLLTDLSAAGVTIIQMDKELDHGPILCQQSVNLPTPILGRDLDKTLSLICGDLLAHVIQELPKGTIHPTPQDHSQATFCTKINKEMAELNLDPHNLPTGEAALEAYCKICAFDLWPEAYFIHNGKRIKIKAAHLDESGKLQITKIVPEGKKEMEFSAYFS
ncbi:MAG TPA: methionyl-tRNA formyltransferase [Candidatus Paceibacterota bacterium]|nr:methionyl-tRNA formyltransferase [Candidatus Paceibacterota bacterium]HMO83101.1 methionyl-tRNA formyltransferase [Candidatus Paceibacterota bacterium]